MSNYISKIEQAGIEYAIRDEALSANEVLVNGEVMPSFMEALTAVHCLKTFLTAVLHHISDKLPTAWVPMTLYRFQHHILDSANCIPPFLH